MVTILLSKGKTLEYRPRVVKTVIIKIYVEHSIKAILWCCLSNCYYGVQEYKVIQTFQSVDEIL